MSHEYISGNPHLQFSKMSDLEIGLLQTFRYCTLSKNLLYPTKDLHDCLISLFERNAKSFLLLQIKEGNENSIRCVFCSKPLQRQLRAAHTPSSKGGTFPTNQTQHFSKLAGTVDCVCDHLRFISIYPVHLSVSKM